MKMLFKKEVKHSVVYKTAEPQAPVRSIYVSKNWLTKVGHEFKKPLDLQIGPWSEVGK